MNFPREFEYKTLRLSILSQLFDSLSSCYAYLFLYSFQFFFCPDGIPNSDFLTVQRCCFFIWALFKLQNNLFTFQHRHPTYSTQFSQRVFSFRHLKILPTFLKSRTSGYTEVPDPTNKTQKYIFFNLIPFPLVLYNKCLALENTCMVDKSLNTGYFFQFWEQKIIWRD